MKRLTALLCTAVFAASSALAPAAAGADDAAYAPTTLTAAQILQRARTAAGSLAPGTYTIVAKRHGGGLDATITTYISGEDTRSTEVRGPFTTAWGVYHGQNWHQNANGIVALDSNFAAVEDPNRIALAHAGLPDDGVSVLGETTGANPTYALDVHPQDGPHQIRYYDASTYRLTRVVTWASDRMKHIVTYGSYVAAFGETAARHWHYSDGLPDNESDTTIVSVEKSASIPPLDIPAGRSIFAFPSDKPVVLPATFDDGSVIVRLTINGRGLDFLLDSGAAGIFIDPGVAHELGLTSYGKITTTIGGSIDQSRAIVPDVAVGDLHMKNVVFNVAPISDQHPLVKVVGLLGYDFIASAIVGVDYWNETVTAYPHGSSPTQDVVAKIPVELDDDVPRAEASFENVPGKFLIDTGAYGSLVYDSYFRKLPNHSNLKGTERVGFVGGSVPVAQYRIYNLNFGGVLFKNADVIVPQSSLADFEDYDGIIGRDVLIAYTVYFDYAGQAIYVKYDDSK